MKVNIAFCAAAAILATAAPASATTFTGLYNTGVDDDGVALAASVRDPHYSYTVVDPEPTSIQAGGGSPAATYFVGGYYTPDNGGSKWISTDTNGGDQSLSTYDFKLSFDLDDPLGAQVQGFAGTDDEGLDLLINGISTNQTFDGFGSLTAFTINSGFVAGTNTLDFIVRNGGGPTALRVDGLTGSGTVSAVPEPATWAMLIGGFGFIGGMLRRPNRILWGKTAAA